MPKPQTFMRQFSMARREVELFKKQMGEEVWRVATLTFPPMKTNEVKMDKEERLRRIEAIEKMDDEGVLDHIAILVMSAAFDLPEKKILNERVLKIKKRFRKKKEGVRDLGKYL